MALPSIMRKLFRNDGYGPLLKPEIIPFAADLASKSADFAASTEWVKDLSVAPVYLDPNGSDSNDGLSSGTPVQTFEKAMEIGYSLPGSHIKLIVAAGTYNSSLVVSGTTVQVVFLGNTTINGQIASLNTSYVALAYEGTEPTVTVSYTSHSNANTHNAVVYAHGNSYLYVNVALNVSGGNSSVSTQSLIGAYKNSFVLVNKPVQASGYAEVCIYAVEKSEINLENTLTGASNANIDRFITVHIFSVINLAYAVTGTSKYAAINVTQGSMFYCSATITVTTTTGNDYYSVYVRDNAYVSIDTLVLNRNHSTDGGVAFLVYGNSHANCGSITITTVKSVYTFIYVDSHSFMQLFSYLKLSGAATARCIGSSSLSGFYVPANLTIVNNATGVRYATYIHSIVNSSGKGANAFPGNAAGTVDSTSTYY